MASRTKKVLHIDLSKQEYDVRSHLDLGEYIGGVGMNARLMSVYPESNPIIFSIGPMNGFFPLVSKTAVLFKSGEGLKDIYLGGSLSSRLKFTGIDAVILYGKSKRPISVDIMDEEVSFRDNSVDMNSLGLPGKRSVLEVFGPKVIVDNYFEAPGNSMSTCLENKNVGGIVVTGTKVFDVSKKEKYLEVYNKVRGMVKDTDIEMAGKPSCVGCTLGCENSRVGEEGGDVLVHSLVACTYAGKIYSDTNTTFSCLNVLGYDYTHEDIENFPSIVLGLMEELKEL